MPGLLLRPIKSELLWLEPGHQKFSPHLHPGNWNVQLALKSNAFEPLPGWVILEGFSTLVSPVIQYGGHVRNWRSKGHLAPLMRPTKFPEIPVSLERNTEVFPTPSSEPFLPS